MFVSEKFEMFKSQMNELNLVILCENTTRTAKIIL